MFRRIILSVAALAAAFVMFLTGPMPDEQLVPSAEAQIIRTHPACARQPRSYYCGFLGRWKYQFYNLCSAQRLGARNVKRGRCVTGAVCPNTHAAVCGTYKGRRVQFQNACQARQSGVTRFTRGACGSTTPANCGGYRPVCGITTYGAAKTYGNRCKAQKDRAIRIRQGRCPACRLAQNWVCGTPPTGKRRTYQSRCFAQAALARNVVAGRCGAARCPNIGPAVSGTVRGKCVNFRNACQARKAGATNLSRFRCDPSASPGCPGVTRPVCAHEGNGRAGYYANACTARKRGRRLFYNGRCRSRCYPGIRQPVCGRVGGRLRNFANRCLATQARARVVNAGVCRVVRPIRPRVLPCAQQPKIAVCAVYPTGVRNTFTNACFARQARARVLFRGRCP